MKKKIALILASAMAISTVLPMNVFGAVVNSGVTPSQGPIPKETLLYDRLLQDIDPELQPTPLPVPTNVTNRKGSDLNLRLDYELKDGNANTFQVNLEKADWAFENENTATGAVELNYNDTFSYYNSSTKRYTYAGASYGIQRAIVEAVKAANGITTTAGVNIPDVKQIDAAFAGIAYQEAIESPNSTTYSHTHENQTLNNRVENNGVLGTHTSNTPVPVAFGYVEDPANPGTYIFETSTSRSYYPGTVDHAVDDIIKSLFVMYNKVGTAQDLGLRILTVYNTAGDPTSGINELETLKNYDRFHTAIKTGIYQKAGVYGSADYYMDISGLYKTTATVTILNKISQQVINEMNGNYYNTYNAFVRIPLVAKTHKDASGDIKVNATSVGTNNTVIVGGTFTLGSLLDAATSVTVSVGEVTTERDTFIIDKLILKENLIGSIRGNRGKTPPTGYTDSDPDFSREGNLGNNELGNEGPIMITAPAGYKFLIPDPDKTKKTTDGKVLVDGGLIKTPINVTFEDNGRTYTRKIGNFDATGDLKINNSPVPANTTTNITDAGYGKLANGGTMSYGYHVTSGANAYRSIVITTGADFQPSTSHTGTMFIENLQLINYGGDINYGEDVKITVRGGGVKEQTITVGKRVDRGVSLRIDTGSGHAPYNAVTNLVSGRFEPYTLNPETMTNDRVYTNVNANDKTHRTARVIFEELTSNSWWAERKTTFTLPEGVKFIKVDVIDSSLIYANSKENNSTVVIPGISKGVVPNLGEYVTKSGNNSHDKVWVDDNVLTIESTTKDRVGKAKIVMDIWVSVEADYAPGADKKDITLTVDGDFSIPANEEAPAPLVIATAQAPVTVDAKVTNVKIGFQVVPTADVTLTENFAGALQKDKTIVLSMDKFVTSTGGLILTDDYKDNFTISTGNITLGKKSGNVIVTKASTTASTIKFSDVAVSIDRTVPFSNKNAYKLIAGGSAIAANSHANDSRISKGLNGDNRATFGTKGIAVDYLKVATGSSDVLTEEVKVTIGENTYTMNGVEKEMDAAAYLTEDGNTMVPIRFVANALGVQDTDIVWDDSIKRVTIFLGDSGRSVQWTANNDTMKVNGADITMVGANNQKVTPEIVDSRLYIPFRQIGRAFGVTVDWDPAPPGTAIFNPTQLVETAAAAE